MKISRWILPRMRNVLDQRCIKNQNIHFTFKNLLTKIVSLWDNVEKCGGARGATNDVTTWRIHVACWKSKATCTYAHAHSQAPGYMHARTHAHADQYVILIAFPRQQWFANAPQCCFTRTLPVLLHNINGKPNNGQLLVKLSRDRPRWPLGVPVG